MILVLGGTTEGRKAVETLDKAGKKFYYSTRFDMQEVRTYNAKMVTGGLDVSQMKEFCVNNDIRLIVDAAHPFAAELHATVSEVSRNLSIPAIRYERRYATRHPDLVWCKDYNDAVNKLFSNGIGRLLALTGVQTISKLEDFWKEHDCYFRILNREESIRKVHVAGFSDDKIVFSDDKRNLSEIINEINPDAIITKESGESGGYSDKVETAKKHGLKIFVISRPPMPEGFITVTGNYGLRRNVERLLPGFFNLRSGFTSGSCATAAAKAALLKLVGCEVSDYVSFHLPDGEKMEMRIESVRVINTTTAEAVVIKDAGDDPDVTDGCQIIVRVELAQHHDVIFHGGKGIGIVTLPGTGLEIGEPAINPTPRQMIKNELLELYPSGCNVTINVPDGEEIAKHTFNSRIGIEGGISIIGTSGIVMPFSNEAFLESIKKEMEVAIALGCERIVLNSGARSERPVKHFYPHLHRAAFIHYGNAIGEILRIADDLKVSNLSVGLMIGKAVKLAEGHSDTHSHKAVMNREFIAQLLREAGCDESTVENVNNINMARELWTLLSDDEAKKFFPYLLLMCKRVCREFYPNGSLTLMLINDSGEIYCSEVD